MRAVDRNLWSELSGDSAASNNLVKLKGDGSDLEIIGGSRQKLSPGLVFIKTAVKKELAILLEQQKPLPEPEDLLVMIDQTADSQGFVLNSEERNLVLENIETEQQPFGILQELSEDPAVNDIIVSSYTDVTLQKGRKNFKTALSFSSQQEYENFVEKILSRADQTYSTKQPVVDGMYNKSVRIHAVHPSICENGPYLTIRFNRHHEITTEELCVFGLAPEPLLQYLSAIVASGQTVLLAGEVGTGKTTLLRALATAVPKAESVLVIEDTPEIKLTHQHSRYIQTRISNTEDAGRITPAQCIRAGMRMAMNRIIFGEIRDGEAAESFIDVCASGHPGISTIHARTASDAVSRLELFLGRVQSADPQTILRQIANAIQVVVHIGICRTTGKRRIKEVVEITGFADAKLRQNCIFKYRPVQGQPAWQVVNRFSHFAAEIEEVAGFKLNNHSQNLSLSKSEENL